jgi:hypothetical protein
MFRRKKNSSVHTCNHVWDENANKSIKHIWTSFFYEKGDVLVAICTLHMPKTSNLKQHVGPRQNRDDFGAGSAGQLHIDDDMSTKRHEHQARWEGGRARAAGYQRGRPRRCHSPPPHAQAQVLSWSRGTVDLLPTFKPTSYNLFRSNCSRSRVTCQPVPFRLQHEQSSLA